MESHLRLESHGLPTHPMPDTWPLCVGFPPSHGRILIAGLIDSRTDESVWGGRQAGTQAHGGPDVLASRTRDRSVPKCGFLPVREVLAASLLVLFLKCVCLTQLLSQHPSFDLSRHLNPAVLRCLWPS